MKRLLLVVAALVFLLAGCVSDKSPEGSISTVNEDMSLLDNADYLDNEDSMGYTKISAEEAKQIIDGDEQYILLDVRTEDEYSASRIDGAILIPNTEINTRAPVELPDKDVTILVYCRSGVRSAAASAMLAQLGYAHVYDFGGIIDWPYETVK